MLINMHQFKALVHHFDQRFMFLKLIPVGGNVLDLGCGDFSSTAKLLECRKDIKWHCVDVVRPEHVPSEVSFNVCDLETERLPYEDAFFDAVFAMHVVEHISDIDHLACL